MIFSPWGYKGTTHKAALLQDIAGKTTAKVNSHLIFTQPVANQAACTLDKLVGTIWLLETYFGC